MAGKICLSGRSSGDRRLGILICADLGWRDAIGVTKSG